MTAAPATATEVTPRPGLSDGRPHGGAAVCVRCGQVHRKCRAHNRAGNPCGLSPKRGQRVCGLHGGKSPQALAAAKRRLAVEEIRRELDRGYVPYGTEVEIDALDALVGQVTEAAGNIEILRRQVWELEQRYVSLAEQDEGSAPGIAGPDHLGDGAQHILFKMYNEERERLARFSKLCIDAGVAQRQVDLAEQLGGQITEVLRVVASWMLGRVREGVDADVIEVELPGQMRSALVAVGGRG